MNRTQTHDLTSFTQKIQQPSNSQVNIKNNATADAHKLNYRLLKWETFSRIKLRPIIVVRILLSIIPQTKLIDGVTIELVTFIIIKNVNLIAFHKYEWTPIVQI